MSPALISVVVSLLTCFAAEYVKHRPVAEVPPSPAPVVEVAKPL